MKQVRVALVSWEDAQFCQDAEIGPGDPTPAPLIVHSVGFVVTSNRREIVLSIDWTEDDGVHRAVQRIPRGMVRSTEILWQHKPTKKPHKPKRVKAPTVPPPAPELHPCPPPSRSGLA